jgi:UDP-glucose 4-epimerase
MGTPSDHKHPPFNSKGLNMIVFDLNRNDSDVLLRHIDAFRPESGDIREDARLRDALLELRIALVAHLEVTAASGFVASESMPL